MVAEDPNLLHPDKAKPGARKLYAEGYSLDALRAQCVRGTTWDKHHDRYEGIKIVFRALAHGQEALRDSARADADRAENRGEGDDNRVTPELLRRFGIEARKKIRDREGGSGAIISRR